MCDQGRTFKIEFLNLYFTTCQVLCYNYKINLSDNIINQYKKILENGRISNVILSSNSNNYI